MALRGRPYTFRAQGLTDAIDGSNTFQGSMLTLKDLIFSSKTKNQLVPRPASIKLTTFVGVAGTPTVINALLQIGDIAYGMVANTSGAYNGLDVPFAYNVATNTFQVISIPRGATSLPATPSAAGDWTPPIMAVVGSRILVTHPGFAGGAGSFFGWLDISGFSDNTHTGDSHTNTTIDNLSANVLQAGWQVGMKIQLSNGDIPANTTIISIASNGLSLVLSQATTGTHAGGTLTVSGGGATTPLWDSGNTNGFALVAVPVSVFNFNGRAYYGTSSGVQFSDSGVACQITNASQAVTFKNGVNVTALAGLPLSSSQLGGIIQSLIVFQGDANMVQISGDPTTNNFTVNNLGVGVGTLSPLTICQTPLGVAFVSPDGLRVIDFLARVSDPIGYNGDGIAVPFQQAVAPSRMCAAYNQNTLRISVQDGSDIGQPFEEYWLDFTRKTWTGPHSFPAALIQAYQGKQNSFILAAVGINAELWQSDTISNPNSTYVENGVQMTWDYQTTLWPDSDSVAENTINEALVALQLPPTASVTVIPMDESGLTLDQLTISGLGVGPTVWGSFTWGSAPWGSTGGYLRQYPLNWSQPLVFKQMSLQMSGNSVAGLTIGNFYCRVQPLGYNLQAAGGRI